MRRPPDQVIADAAPLARMTRERDILRGTLKDTVRALSAAQERITLLEHFNVEHVDVAPWTRVKKPTSARRATVALQFSDQHYDEVVNPSEMEGLNAYNRDIAVLRTKECFRRTIMMAREYLGGVSYDGLALILGGDTFSGNIHEELQQTNEDTLFGSLLFWINELSGFIGGLTDEFKKVHVTCVAGNHGRLTRKPRAKFYARDNLDWLLYNLLARESRTDHRITWNVPDSRDAELHIYETHIRVTHGDQAKGGSGISGKRTPLALLEHRKMRRVMQAKQRPFDCVFYHHWHEYDPAERMLGNGSLKGIDEYSLGGEFGCEPPKQSFVLVTPEHGISVKAPIYCAASRKVEGW